MSNIIDFKVVKKMLSDQELEDFKKSIVHPKTPVDGKQKAGTVVFRRKANYSESFGKEQY
ncbi:hypothetical protein [Niallia nealsonii]|uniref:Uncharacterized protein n=1 Tax=Niallia nealsonii TaxID=115979 RepID=A0A2N0Z0C3_9BACI|nr:hypothetical protein [Niallia nealsonii]PKG22962.1 hypothetical protein CWS01_14915 [Niallia nealsonii]